MSARVVYYSDELHDDFAGTNIDTKPLPEGYRYIRRGIFWRIGEFIIYRVIAQPLVWLYTKAVGHSFRNRRVLKKAKREGMYFYGNHTNMLLDSFVPHVVRYTGHNYIVAGPDAMSLTALRVILEMMGVIPLGTSLSQSREMSQCVAARTQEGGSVTIYPEAHIWPYYTDIRPFPSNSFRFPVQDGKPVYTLTTCYKKRLIGSRPRAVTFVDGPFYADADLPKKAAMQQLRDRCLATMEARARENSTCEYIKYIKKDEN